MAVMSVDWRHWENIEEVVRTLVDFYTKNGGLSIPVEVVDFKANLIDTRVMLSWATMSELGTDRFEVERATKTNGIKSAFNTISVVKALGKNDSRYDYAPVADNDIRSGNTYIYRLKSVDLDGSVQYTSEREVSLEGNGTVLFGQAQPNPANNVAQFELTNANGNEEIIVRIADAQGNVQTVDYTVEGNLLSVDVKNLNSGSYTLVFEANGTRVVRQLRVVK